LELHDEEGHVVINFKDLVDLSVSHFGKIFKEVDPCPLGEIMNLISKYPRLVEEHENEDLYREVTKDEILIVMSSFQKDCSPSLDRWMVKFYIAFLT
jgi:hypothetical protein